MMLCVVFVFHKICKMYKFQFRNKLQRSYLQRRNSVIFLNGTKYTKIIPVSEEACYPDLFQRYPDSFYNVIDYLLLRAALIIS